MRMAFRSPRLAVPRTLGVVAALLERLHAEEIVYCHWKGNANLSDAVSGTADLDVLVERSAAVALGRILSETGFKHFTATPERAVPAIEDYLAVDTETGRLVHLHLHFQLMTGEHHLKAYHLPWEHLVLTTRQLDPTWNLYIADPNVQFVLHMVRAVLKMRTRDRMHAWVGRPFFERAQSAEYAWLKRHIESTRVGEIAAQLLGRASSRVLLAMLEKGLTWSRFRAFEKSVRPTVRLFRRYSATGAALGDLWREFQWLRGVLNKWYLHRPTPFTRTPSTGGAIIAIVGPDGSGKSTLVQALFRWLSWKVDAMPVYFGSGDGPSSLLRWPLQAMLKLLRSRRATTARLTERRADTTKKPESRQRRGWYQVGLLAWALTLSYEKRRKLRGAWLARNRGMVVFCDRFPQAHVSGFNDGPLLTHWLDHPLRPLRAMARWERTPYVWAQIYGPDLVVRLHVTPEVAQARKSEMWVSEIRRKGEAIATLRYPPATRVAEIDGDGSIDDVLLKVKQVVWDAL